MRRTTNNGSLPFELIILVGDYDLARQGELQQEFAAARSLELAVIDMRCVTFLDSTALTELPSLKNQLTGPAIVRIVGAPAHICKLFHSTGLDKTFDLHDSFATASVPFLSLVPDR
jgi:anti-anti-sigma factor